MSETPPPILPPVPTPPQARSGCLTAFMILCGIILLLPGLCAILFGGMSVAERGEIASDIAPLVFLGLLIGIGGVALIWAAVSGRRSRSGIPP